VTQPGGGSLEPQGPVAEAMADLWWLMLVLGAAVFVVVAGLLVVALFRRPRPAEFQAGAGLPNRFGRWMIAGGVVLPFIVLVVVLGATLRAMRFVPNTAPPEALVIEVIGHQWWWEVRYPTEGITTANELHIPVGRPIALELTSADVIHSFWVPRLAGKLDLLPDGTNTLVLQADEPGQHHTQCAEFCGLQHAHMELRVVAEPQERFASWVAARARPAADPTGATAQRGQEVFLASGCAECHAIEGTPAEATRGPDLTHLASRPTIGAGVMPNTPENIADWVADPHPIKSGVKMPAADLAEEELDAVVAYLNGLE
jgi:cytochrome c oxidase subunit 2